MAENTIKTRLQMKNDTEANWNKAVNFIPKQGEMIVYNVDDEHNKPRIKVGDGETNVINLPFIEADEINENLLINSENMVFTALYVNTGSFVDGPEYHRESIEEWGATDAIYIEYGSNFVHAENSKFYLLPAMLLDSNKEYTYSIYFYNYNSESITLSVGNTGEHDIVIGPKEQGYYTLTFTGNDTDKYANCLWIDINENFTYWHPKLEEGNKATPWIPSPYDINYGANLLPHSSIKKYQDEYTCLNGGFTFSDGCIELYRKPNHTLIKKETNNLILAPGVYSLLFEYKSIDLESDSLFGPIFNFSESSMTASIIEINNSSYIGLFSNKQTTEEEWIQASLDFIITEEITVNNLVFYVGGTMELHLTNFQIRRRSPMTSQWEPALTDGFLSALNGEQGQLVGFDKNGSPFATNQIQNLMLGYTNNDAAPVITFNTNVFGYPMARMHPTSSGFNISTNTNNTTRTLLLRATGAVDSALQFMDTSDPDNKFLIFHSGMTIPIENGGTGATDSTQAIANLGISGSNIPNNMRAEPLLKSTVTLTPGQTAAIDFYPFNSETLFIQTSIVSGFARVFGGSPSYGCSTGGIYINTNNNIEIHALYLNFNTNTKIMTMNFARSLYIASNNTMTTNTNPSVTIYQIYRVL